MKRNVKDLMDLYNRRLEVIKKLRDVLRDDPAFAKEIIKALTPAKREGTPRRSSGKSASRNLRAVKDFLRSVGNEWRTAAQIMEHTGLNRNQLSQIIYKDYRDLFERAPYPGHGRTMQYRMKDPTQTAPETTNDDEESTSPGGSEP